MGDIQTFRRKELPPSRVGQVAPIDLPAREVDPTLGFIAASAGRIFDDYVETKTANEKAQFKIDVATAQQTAILEFAKRPGMSLEDRGVIRKQMFSDFDIALTGMTMPEAKRSGNFYVENNTELIGLQFDTETAEIGIQYELKATEVNLDKLSLQGGKMAEIRKLINDQVDAGLLSRPAGDAKILRREQIEVTRLDRLIKEKAIEIEKEKKVIVGEIKENLLNSVIGLSTEEAFKEIDANEILTFDEKQDVRAEYGVRKNMLANEEARAENERTIESERDLYKEYNEGAMTQEGLDKALSLDVIDTDLHATYKGLLEDKSLRLTDSILAEKWLNNVLTEDDIKTAQKEGRLLNSNVVASWKARLGEDEKFNTGVYDQALVRIREVRTNKTKYNEVRTWLLKNAKELGFQWGDTRNKLETAMSHEPKAESTPHISRAHRLVDNYAKNNPEISDGTLGSVRRMQEIHDAIDAREDLPPAQIRDLTQALLMPYEEEKAKGWISGYFEWYWGLLFNEKIPFMGLSPLGIYRKANKVRAEKQGILNNMLLIQPVSKSKFRDKVNSLKTLFGNDSKEARLFYDKYVDSYDWEIE